MYANIRRNTCKHPSCKLPVFAGGFCKYHQLYREEEGRGTPANIAKTGAKKRFKKDKDVEGKSKKCKPNRPNKPISRQSKKRSVINRIYAERSKNFRAANPTCRIQSPICTGKTQGVHHVKGKATIELLLDEAFWLPSCNPCNSTWIEEHPEWAKEKGFKILDGSSKLSKFKK